ncbi:DUF3078 domain-containing protein [Hymenobacter cavernae]|uniref:DUF3078 domain-containing protein n=1 Tax=Hymenobacter cavernae TaxID=2044852 RepID=UPI001667EA21|nr:DUF3078 domain-containing protein [Hymenobacter cavernae]
MRVRSVALLLSSISVGLISNRAAAQIRLSPVVPPILPAPSLPAIPKAKLDTLVAIVRPPSPWKTAFKGTFNLNESALSSNWRGGGVNSIGLNAQINQKANFHRGRSSWDNEADFLYAFVANKDQGYRKSLDRLFLDTKYGCNISTQWNAFASLNLLTQFAPGYKYSTNAAGEPQAQRVSSAFAPAYITLATGMEYVASKWFKIRLSPLASRVTIVGHRQRFVDVLGEKPYGVRAGHSANFEALAGQVLTEIDKNITTNVNLKARYLLFADYQKLALRRLDHRLDASMTAKVNRYINVALTGILLYDYDQDRALQYSQGLSLGLIYTRQNTQEGKK